MLVHTALATHKEPKRVLVISENRTEIETEFSRERFINLEVSFSNLEIVPEFSENEFDVAIIEEKPSKLDFAHLKRVLSNEGVLTMVGDFETLENLASEFRIAMPFLVNSLEITSEILLLGSKFYHPTADINLQRADFLDGCEYYNSDIHVASFVMPNYIKSQIREFVKN
jgi:spermidine synthase